MSRHRMFPPSPVDLSNPASLSVWAGQVHVQIDALRPLVQDATMRHGLRRQSRRYLRRMMCRILRDVEVLVDVITAPPQAAVVEPASPQE